MPTVPMISKYTFNKIYTVVVPTRENRKNGSRPGKNHTGVQLVPNTEEGVGPVDSGNNKLRLCYQ